MNKVELLAPAGSMEKLRVAFLYGADAVYIGGKNYSLRANATNFKLSEIKEAVKYAHKLKKKVYVTVNIIFHNEDYKDLVSYLHSLSVIDVDAIIASDPSIIDIVKKNKIDIDIHLSTQASTANYEAVKFWKSLGIKRVVLARECSREDIKAIIKKTGVEVECFLHGAMCSAYSGRCVLSNYFTNRDANRGGCAQICRWVFDLNDGYSDIENETKFTMSTKDLSMINCLGDMIDIGVSSLKVEGRMRSNYYIATVISTYREAIDLYYKGELTEEKLKYFSKVLNRVANRESTEQFFSHNSCAKDQYFVGREEYSNQDFLGIVMNYEKETGIVTLTQRNYFKPGDVVEIFGPSIKAFSFTMPEIYNEEGDIIDVANHPKQIVKFRLDREVYPNDIMRVKI